MTNLVASLTLDSARSYVMQGVPFSQGMISSIPIGVSISPEGFLPLILLLVVIIVTVVVILVVVVVVIVGVVIVIFSPSDPIGSIYSNGLGVCIPPGQSITSQGVPVGLVFLLGLLVLAIVVAYASRAAVTLSVTSSSGSGSLPSGRVNLTGDEDPTDEDRDIGMGDSTGVSMSLGGEISSGGKKSQE
ncbi:hypothetical protein Tco_0407341 [Tanacetum coccineum]